MLIRVNENSRKKDLDFYCKSTFFIFPFVCNRCKNTFMFERGIKLIRIPMEGCGSYAYIDNSDFFDEPSKYCDICSNDICEHVKAILKHWEKKDEENRPSNN